MLNQELQIISTYFEYTVTIWKLPYNPYKPSILGYPHFHIPQHHNITDIPGGPQQRGVACSWSTCCPDP